MEIFIPGNCPSSKNGKIFTGRYLVWSKAAQKYRKESKPYWDKYREQFISQIHEYPIRLSLLYIRGSRHQFDYVNPCQSTLDLMVENSWLTDDNADVVVPVFESYIYDKTNPGTIIKIL